MDDALTVRTHWRTDLLAYLAVAQRALLGQEGRGRDDDLVVEDQVVPEHQRRDDAVALDGHLHVLHLQGHVHVYDACACACACAW